MALSPEQIATVQDITKVSSLSDLTARAANQSAEQNTLTVADITEWEKIKNKFYQTSNDIPLQYSVKRLEIRNRVRVRFGYPEIDEFGQVVDSQNVFFPSCSVSKNVGW